MTVISPNPRIGGIVAESDPDDEVAETNTKFRTILSALGVST